MLLKALQEGSIQTATESTSKQQHLQVFLDWIHHHNLSPLHYHIPTRQPPDIGALAPR